MESFFIEDYLREKAKQSQGGLMGFERLCQVIKEDFIKEWDDDGEDMSHSLEIQKKAIIGYANEGEFFKKRIKSKLENYNIRVQSLPPWYKTVLEGVYHENWGLAGIAQWFSEEYKNSGSAKIIGDRIYFMKEGQMKLMPQKIDKHRREQLIRAFLLLTPNERLDKNFHEVYLLDGTRVTIFNDRMTKSEQDVIVFRRYIVPCYTFEEQSGRGTIPEVAIPLFKSMVSFGPNVVIAGQVRSSKTTFLSTWQSYENPALEGVMVETDPEIPMHKIIPDAPIVQIIADNDQLSGISKNLLRSDADYFILAEARDGNALETATRIASKGTRRMKLTFHCRDPLNFPYDAAWEIIKTTGGDLKLTAQRVAAGFDYIFHFVQLKNKNEKRLKGIYDMSFDVESGEIVVQPICIYNYKSDNWRWNYYISRDKEVFAKEENQEAFQSFADKLFMLATKYPIEEKEGKNI